MKTIALPVPEDPFVTVAFSFAAGSQNDPPGKEGLASLTADMLVEGATRRLSYEDILEALYPMAADYDVTVDKEMTTIDGCVHRDKLDEFIPLLTEAVLEPAFLESDFARLRSDALNYLSNTLRYSSDEELARAMLISAIFRDTRYAHPVEGTIASLESITLDDVRGFYAEHFIHGKLVLGIGGGFPQELPSALESACAPLPQGSGRIPPPVDPAAIRGRRVVLIDKPGADTSISFGFPLGVRRGERDFYSLWLANSWLGEHRHGASRLFQLIREQRGLNYGDYSYIEAFPDAGELEMPPVNVPRTRQMFEVWIRTLPNEQAVFALRAALREIDRLIERGLTAEQFELTRTFLTRYSAHYAPTTAARLGYALDDVFYGLTGEGHLERLKRTLAELTVDEVNAAIRQHWQTDDLVIAIVTGASGALAETLVAGKPTPIEYANPMPEEILGEDEEIAVYPLRIGPETVEAHGIARVFQSA